MSGSKAYCGRDGKRFEEHDFEWMETAKGYAVYKELLCVWKKSKVVNVMMGKKDGRSIRAKDLYYWCPLQMGRSLGLEALTLLAIL